MKKIQSQSAINMESASSRCLAFRKRILEISQQVSALHIGSAYSCTEIVDAIYFQLMRNVGSAINQDTFIMSKGHGCMIQYVILEQLGVLSKGDIDLYCKSGGILGCHPDYGNPGIVASTGSLGHGLSISVGIALAEKSLKGDGKVFCVLSDGELQEGSTWEATMMASSLGLDNLIAFVDNNDFQSLGRTSITHPSFYPLVDKFIAFGWSCVEVDGHDSAAISSAVMSHQKKKPLMVICKTIKGKGVSFMENIPMWHYRSPSPEEFAKAMIELEGSSEL
jgi:transketolase